MMAVFPCRSGASQNPMNLRASRFENTCEKNNHSGSNRCFCISQGLGGRRGLTLDAGARLGSSLDLGSSSLFPSRREANPGLFAPSRTGSPGHPPLPAHLPDPDGPSPQPKSPTISTAASKAACGLAPAFLTAGLPACPRPVPPAVADPGRPSRYSPHAALIEAKLEAGLSAQRIHQDLVAEVGFSGSDQSVKRFLRRLRGAAVECVWRIEVQLGHEARVDFGTGVWVINSLTGVRRRPAGLAVMRRLTGQRVFAR